MRSDSLTVVSFTFLSVFTASVLPSRSLGERMSLSLATTMPEKSWAGLVRTKVPGATILTGTPLLWASSTDTRFEPPMSVSPDTTDGITVAPPWLGWTFTSSLRFLK